jgi:PAS domain S-box-containing protein
MFLLKDSMSKGILLLAVISVLLLAAYDVFFVFPSFNGLLMENSESEAVDIASHLREDLLSGDVRLKRSSLPDIFIKTAERTKRDFNLWKILIFSPSAEIVYSTDPADLGRRISGKFFYGVVAKGGVYKKYVPKNELTPGGQVAKTYVVSAYVPVMKDGRFLGACEVYMDVTDAITRNSRLFLTSIVTLFLLVFGLLLSVIIVSRKAGSSTTARKKAEDALQESEHFLRTIIETEPECVKLLAADKTLLMMNPAGLAMIEADSLEQVKGNQISSLVLPEYRDAFDNLTRNVFRGKSGTLEFEAVGLKGRRLWLSTHAVPLLDKKGEIAALLGITRDITQEKSSTEALEASLKEKEILLRELYHRTKNNLQVISSLISLQAAYINDDRVMQAFDDTRNRIQAMSLVHEKLYKSKNLICTDVKDYIEDLTDAILGSRQEPTADISLIIDVDSTFLAIDTITTLGLIINELMTNSLKYAFPGDRDGEIRISFHMVDRDRMAFVFSDNGVGLPSTDIKNMKSLGLKLVNNLAMKQLGGRLEVKTGKGTEFRLTFQG